MSSLKSIPATTDAKRLAEEIKKRHDAHHMSVVFSTYHSLDVISRAQPSTACRPSTSSSATKRTSPPASRIC